MYKICVFAGTTEGREVVSFLSSQPVSVTACVATEYGETLLTPAENLTISSERLTGEEMQALFLRENFDLVIDATHPYAKIVTENIAAAAEAVNLPYLRLLREASEVSGEAVYVPDIEGAVEYLNKTEGAILLTTGSKELSKFTGIRDFEDRVYARLLPMQSSLEACQAAGVKPAKILAMQGPFTEEMNTAMLKFTGAKYLVTKDGGATGGFPEKIEAAGKAGVTPVVIGRPPQREGRSLSEVIGYLSETCGLSRIPEVSIVGIGPGSREAMTGEVVKAIRQADCLIGAKRMLEAVAAPGQPVVDAIAPDAIEGAIREHKEFSRFTVVMSGDVGFFSGTKKLLPLLTDMKVQVLPGLSSLVYLCSRVHISYEDVKVVSLHGREKDICRVVRENEKTFALVGGENGMGKLCRDLTEGGLGHVKLHIGEKLSYPDEVITEGTAEELKDKYFASLSVVLIENAAPDAVVTHGLPDEVFQRGDGAEGVVPMTKSEVRAICLSKLRLTERSVCWDIGAGTGSVAIEMALQAKKGEVYAIERKTAALELLEINKKKFGADNMTIIGAAAPDGCEVLPAPTHAFIGGSSGNMRQILELLMEKNPGVRIVATAIALESVAELTACMKSLPFTETEVVSIQAARDRKAGPYHLMTANNPIYIFTMQAGTK